MGIPPVAREPDDNPTIRDTNLLVKPLADSDNRVEFFDMGPRLLNRVGCVDPAIQPDGVHFSPAGYQIWAETIEPVVARWVDDWH